MDMLPGAPLSRTGTAVVWDQVVKGKQYKNICPCGGCHRHQGLLFSAAPAEQLVQDVRSHTMLNSTHKRCINCRSISVVCLWQTTSKDWGKEGPKGIISSPSFYLRQRKQDITSITVHRGLPKTSQQRPKKVCQYLLIMPVTLHLNTEADG